jgi:acyl dehydratase
VADAEFDAKLQALVAEQGEAPATPARDPVNQPMIRHWCDAIDDQNPVYSDPEFAEKSVHGGIVAPPTMLQAWTMRGLRPPVTNAETAPTSQDAIFALLDSAGFTSVVATNCVQEYKRYLHLGDELSVQIRTESVSPEKQTALGIGHFVTQRQTYRDAEGNEVANMLFRLLKFKPGTGAGAA